MRKRSLLGGLALASLLATACEKTGTDQPVRTLQPITAQEVSDLSARAVRGHALEVQSALVELASSDLARTLGFASAAPESREEAAQEADEIAREVIARLLANELVESSEETRVTYRLSPDRTCREPDGVEPDCARLLTQIPVRLVVTSPSAGALEIALLIGEDELNPFVLRLSDSLISLEIDLGDLQQAVERVAAVVPFDRDFGPDQRPDSASGRILISLAHVAGSAESVATVSVLDAVSIDNAGRYGYHLAIAARPGAVASVTLNAQSGDIAAAADFGAIDFSAPLSLLDPDRAGLTGTLSAHLAGLGFSAALAVDAERAEITGLNLGSSASLVSLDGATLARLDLNASRGRTLNATVQPAGDGVEITVAPALEIALMLELAPLVARSLEVPDWMVSERLGLTFDGAAAPRIVLVEQEDTVSTGGSSETDPSVPMPPPVVEERIVARVIDGFLALRSSSRPAIEVGAGACLASVPAPAPATDEVHPFETLAVRACP